MSCVADEFSKAAKVCALHSSTPGCPTGSSCSTCGIDEFLRYYAPATIERLIKEEVSVACVPLKAGHQVLRMLPVANHDPRTFPYPDTLIADRSPNKHLGFGTGVHRCLGAYILRVEARIVIEQFLARIPEFELDRSRMAPLGSGSSGRYGHRADRF
jgi:cytochrome P450